MDKKEYWEGRFVAEGKIWGDSPSLSAHSALKFFLENHVKSVLVPGSGYGRNTKLFSSAGLDVVGVEISETAYQMAKQFDPRSKFYRGTVLDISFDNRKYDAIYCFNVLHLFRQTGREMFLLECIRKLKDEGLAYFTVFSDKEESFGRGTETEVNTFESKPGRPVHYFTEVDLRNHFDGFEVMDIGNIKDPENHGGHAHVHILRYIVVRLK